ncbi:hypothetical protein B0H11DRAFT_2316805 [Mycena galericulata]|nr:hypothetical protein B0H11DRAFT_2316805 [Mycena galericulata]
MAATSNVLPTPLVLTRHPELYFEDGSIIIRTVSGTLYNVYRVLLGKKSGFFSGLFDLPLVAPPGQKAPPAGADYKTIQVYNGGLGLDGLSDATALVLPDSIEADELDHLFDFIFNMKYEIDEIRPLLSLCAILKLSHFLDIGTGTAYAIHHLSTHPHLRPALRLFLACTYDVDDWVSTAFLELMRTPIQQLTANDYQLIGAWVYKLLVLTHAKVDEHRSGLAFFPPVVLHSPDCIRTEQCVKAWEDAWFGKAGGSGMVSALLDAKLPGAVLYSVMDQFQVFGMRDACRVQTLSSLEDTPEKMSSLKKEISIIEEAVRMLKGHSV